MTAPTTTELLYAWDRKRPRSQQTEIGMSEVGGCERRVGYRLAGTPVTNPSASMQAILGSAIHEPVAQVVQEMGEPGDIAEVEVRFAGLLGHFDRYHAASKTVIDVKTTSSRWLETIKLNGAEYQHRWQVALYGAAIFKTYGVTVERVRIDYIARDTGEEYNWPNLAGAPFDPRDVRDAMQWLHNVRTADINMLPRKYLPDSVFCERCPFRDTCWGEDTPGRNPLEVLYLEDPDAEKWAGELKEVRGVIKTLKDTEKRAAGALSAIRPENGGRVQVGDFTLDFRNNGLYFVSGRSRQAAVGYDEEGTS